MFFGPYQGTKQGKCGGIINFTKMVLLAHSTQINIFGWTVYVEHANGCHIIKMKFSELWFLVLV